MSPRAWIICGALVGATGVSLGAYGAHGLDRFLARRSLDAQTQAKRMADYRTAVNYQMYHAPALLIVGLLAARGRSKRLALAGGLFLAGVLLFSGFLYLWVFTGKSWTVHPVPFGGVAFILAWLLLATAFAQPATPRDGKAT